MVNQSCCFLASAAPMASCERFTGTTKRQPGSQEVKPSYWDNQGEKMS